MPNLTFCWNKFVDIKKGFGKYILRFSLIDRYPRDLRANVQLYHRDHLWEKRLGNLHELKKGGAGEMAQQLRVLASFPKDPHLFPETHVRQLMKADTRAPGVSKPLL